jgi:HSP20 family protein
MKTVTLYRPVSIEKAMNDFDRYMESFFGDSLLAPASKNLRLPAMDVQEHDEAYSVDIELPGFDEKNIEVHVNGKEITVESKREETSENVEKNADEKKTRFILKERKQSNFRRTFSLPENADYESISAKFKNGILSLEVRKLPEAKKRTIQIASAE